MSADTIDPDALILLTGATGYIGGRLRVALESGGRRVRCLARRPEFLSARVASETEVLRGDVLDRDSLRAAMNGAQAAYYLVHSMGSTQPFEEQDRDGARNFGEVAREAGVRRIVYLGGLGESSDSLSPHLRSRHEVGELLRSSGVQTIELRASVVIGAGSLSFEMVRALVERLPVMVTPRWVSIEAQPIAVSDVLQYLLAALDLETTESPVFEIGGADRVSYGDIMREYARQRGLTRVMIPVPFLTPRLSSLWLGLVTPLYARVGRKLIDSIYHRTVVKDEASLATFSIRPVGLSDAIAMALRSEDAEMGAPRWSDSLAVMGPQRDWGGVRFGNRLVDIREIHVNAPPSVAFAPIRRIGGRVGWYYGDWLWQFRGFLDLLVGGVGMRRGRRDPEQLTVGDVLDCWRVEALEEGRRLRLAAEMRLPGRAWLEFEVDGDDAGSTIRQTASFDPVGLSGLLYWYGVYPLHQVVFAGMLQRIAREALCFRGND